jgi:sulfotransferase family protein/aspartyl/asparaginyl beta-hydroxylase
MKLQVPFVQLPISFDAAILAAEVSRIDETTWRSHPDGIPGNSALTLITTGGDSDSDELSGTMRPTPALLQCPQLMQVLEALGATWGRSRLMRLSGQSEVTPHVDGNYYWRERMRVHVPLITTPGVRFQCGDSEVNMAAGECWIFDTWRRHRVLNPANDQRIHLVADTVGGDRLWDLINNGRAPGQNRPDWIAQPMALRQDHVAQLDFESVNSPVVMTPWEVRDHIVFLLGDAVPAPQLPALQQALLAFSRRWHALWSCHGESREGWPRYRALLDATWQELLAKGVDQVGLKNELGLARALSSYIFDMALADKDTRSDSARLDRHGEYTAKDPTAPAASAVRAGKAGAAPRFDRPVFIVSPPRSGSTLLFETLAAAPDVFTIGDESHQLIEGIPGLAPGQGNHDSNRLLAADATPAVAASLRERFLRELHDRDGRAPVADSLRMLEKTPKNALRVPFLAAVFPEARFIYLHRDPRQVLGSMIEGWQSGRFATYPKLPAGANSVACRWAKSSPGSGTAPRGSCWTTWKRCLRSAASRSTTAGSWPTRKNRSHACANGRTLAGTSRWAGSCRIRVPPLQLRIRRSGGAMRMR